MERYKSIFTETTLTSKDTMKKWANNTFSKELKELPKNDIVWLQDKAAKYHGYYLVTPSGFEYLGTMIPQAVFKKYNKEENDIEILKESSRK
jgi:hypothetical protein